MNISESKKIIQDLVIKSQKGEQNYDKKQTISEFIRPLFEALGWDFQTDVKETLESTAADMAFKIEGVSRFYLKVFPFGTSIEASRKEIENLTSLAYNKAVTWAIATNFKQLRVYNSEAPGTTLASMQHHSFDEESEYITKFENLGDLTKKQFSLNVLDSEAEYFGKKPKRIPIDKLLLADLILFRKNLIKNILTKNKIKEEDAEHASQKILNRLIFIRSCGDRQIEERYLKSTLSEWEQDKNKKLIEYLHEVFAFFRGRYGSILFEKNICDSLKIDDQILEEIINGLYKSNKKAIQYNFAQIEHDTLGKMYENYLGTVQQKKDGAYYTPSYISKYICENTIIPYLSKSNVTTIPELISEYENDLKELESIIHDIKILDPACGTGEFLIRAVDVLLKISKEIQNKKQGQGQYQHSVKKKKSGLATFQTFDRDIENQQLRTIIQNNIHGVDINEEAIEIAQLNIFLKLATSSQQLLDLSKNLRIGNSLIDDPSVDPKAFDWEKEFPEKFDVVIGNPPYRNLELYDINTKKHLEKYSCYTGKSDILYFFYNLGINLLKQKGILNFITSRYFIENDFANNLRKFILENTSIIKIIDCSKLDVFKKLGIHTCVLQLSKLQSKESIFSFTDINNEYELLFPKIITSLKQSDLDSDQWLIGKTEHIKIFNKINSFPNTVKLIDIIEDIEQGQKTGYNKAYVVDEKIIKNNHLEKHFIKKLVKNSFIDDYFIEDREIFLIYASDYMTTKNAPNIIKYLKKFKNQLSSRAEAKDNVFPWYRFQRPRKQELFDVKEKIIVPYRATRNKFAYDDLQRFNDGGDIRILSNFDKDFDPKYVLGILNSKLMNFYYSFIGKKKGNVYEYFKGPLKKIPIIKPNHKNEQLISRVSRIIESKKKYFIEKNSSELKKIQILKIEIDELVYELYGITDEEKAIIESSI